MTQAVTPKLKTWSVKKPVQRAKKAVILHWQPVKKVFAAVNEIIWYDSSEESMLGLTQFFENSDGRKSMTNLLAFLSFFPASYLAVKIGDNLALGTLLGAYVTNNLGAKGIDAMKKKLTGPDKVKK